MVIRCAAVPCDRFQGVCRAETMIPQLAQLLTPEEVQRIHEASLEILDQVGLEVHTPKARERFRAECDPRCASD